MKRFVYYWITIQDNKHSTNPRGLLKLIPYGKMYSAQTSRNLPWRHVLPPLDADSVEWQIFTVAFVTSKPTAHKQKATEGNYTLDTQRIAL